VDLLAEVTYAGLFGGPVPRLRAARSSMAGAVRDL
jgi:hypothetical protein